LGSGPVGRPGDILTGPKEPGQVEEAARQEALAVMEVTEATEVIRPADGEGLPVVQNT